MAGVKTLKTAIKQMGDDSHAPKERKARSEQWVSLVDKEFQDAYREVERE